MPRAKLISIAPLAVAMLLCARADEARAYVTKGLLSSKPARSDLPARAPSAGSRADTLCFGYVQTIGGALYAVPGESWTFDHGSGGAEGWYAVDLSTDSQLYSRRIDAASWSGHGNTVAAPLISGNASAWVGAFEDEADALCWEGGLGYGNAWCQHWQSPTLSYSGSGDVTISFDYFQDSEPDLDLTRVRLAAGLDEIPLVDLSGKIGNPAISSYAHAQYTIPASMLSGWTSGRLFFDFTSDGGWSDEDGEYLTSYGAFGVDNIVLSGGFGSFNFDFESGEQGWTAGKCGGLGTFFGVANLSDYTIPDGCACRLSSHVLELHDGIGDMGTHPYGQHVRMFSPPIDRASLGAAYNRVFATWDTYVDLPQANGVFQRAGWNYYPYVCPATGQTGWSGRVGNEAQFYWWDDVGCMRDGDVATDGPVPGDAQQVGLVLELFASCDAFGIPSSVCTGEPNFTPLYDNITICATQTIVAPTVSLDTGAAFQDGFAPTYQLSSTIPGNADIAYDLHRGQPNYGYLGDSLVVKGPAATPSAKWEARLWWRLPRIGPGQTGSAYTSWRNAVADGRNIVGPTAEFTFGWMDSLQSGTQVAKNKFISEFREDDDDFAGEDASNNEMIRDNMLVPGTQVQYFITSNFTCTPFVAYLLPDTTGGNFYEFEVLPAFRFDGGIVKYPCILTIDIDSGEQSRVEHALNVVMNGAAPGDPVPLLRSWDRYDYNDATSNWNAPFARAWAGQSGVSIYQLLGYRQIILYTGSIGAPAMEPEDFGLFGDWLSAIICGANGNGVAGRQGWFGAGDDLAQIMAQENPSFSQNYLGVRSVCGNYHDAGCGPSAPADESSCVRLEAASGAVYSPLIDADVTGNWCPQLRAFDVLGAYSGGVGNKVYRDQDRVPPVDTQFSQVARSITASGSSNYRAVTSGYSLGSLSVRDAQAECATDATSGVSAIAEELRAALRWTFQGDANVPTLCQGSCFADVEESAEGSTGVTRLFENRPNPFNPRTTLRFAIATAGRVELVVYDVNGRRVRSLIDTNLNAGAHEVVWDGSDDGGKRVAAGIYWSQLRAGGYESQRKMIVLK